MILSIIAVLAAIVALYHGVRSIAEGTTVRKMAVKRIPSDGKSSRRATLAAGQRHQLYALIALGIEIAIIVFILLQ